jgi:hypothetical protein
MAVAISVDVRMRVVYRSASIVDCGRKMSYPRVDYHSSQGCIVRADRRFTADRNIIKVEPPFIQRLKQLDNAHQYSELVTGIQFKPA